MLISLYALNYRKVESSSQSLLIHRSRSKVRGNGHSAGRTPNRYINKFYFIYHKLASIPGPKIKIKVPVVCLQPRLLRTEEGNRDSQGGQNYNSGYHELG
jgi:hypothetical protein